MLFIMSRLLSGCGSMAWSIPKVPSHAINLDRANEKARNDVVLEAEHVAGLVCDRGAHYPDLQQRRHDVARDGQLRSAGPGRERHFGPVVVRDPAAKAKVTAREPRQPAR